MVIEEINLYRDTPAELIYDDFEERYFGNHPLGHNILGSKKNVRRFTPEILKQFMQRHYTPDRMVISVVGNVEFKKLVHLCQKHFSDPQTIEVKKTPIPDSQFSILNSQFPKFNTSVHKHTHQVHLLAGCPAPTLYDRDKTVFTLLNNIIGGPAMNSRLNVAVREREGFCYTIESQYIPFTDAGLFYIYAGIDSNATERSIELIHNELRHLRETPIHPQSLRAAQKQLIGQMAINNDSGLNEMQSIGKACLNFEHVDTLEEMNRDILAITSQELQEAACKYLTEDKFSLLRYV